MDTCQHQTQNGKSLRSVQQRLYTSNLVRGAADYYLLIEHGTKGDFLYLILSVVCDGKNGIHFVQYDLSYPIPEGELKLLCQHEKKEKKKLIAGTIFYFYTYSSMYGHKLVHI